LDRYHIILGAGGAAGTPLAQELLASGKRLRTVSRAGRGPAGAETRAADLTVAEQVLQAVEEEAVVYLLAGLPYDRKVWRRQWPLIVQNVVAACQQKRARLVFLDNVYAYGKVDGPMTESTPVRPSSVKGGIRAQMDAFLRGEIEAGRLTAIIARAADFYGPYSEHSSIPEMLVFARLAQGKPAQLLGRADTRHSYTYTRDIGRALPLLAEAEDCWNQVWHLPTASPAFTGTQFVAAAARALGLPARLSVAPRWLLQASGLFSTQMREVAEMLYQYDRDYLFDSTRFENRFSFQPTPYEQGIQEAAQRISASASLVSSQA
jgi:nucleoside-diphosphate-sugar epimerase